MTRATGLGSWPGTDLRQAVATVRDLLAVDGGLPYLPELPGRGPGADLIGRGAGLLVDLPVDLQPAGWRFVDRPGKDASRTTGLRREELDTAAEAYDGYAGDLKVQVAGPWTLAASVEMTRGERAVVDEGATRDLVASLAEGVRVHLADLARLVPGARLVLQVDEPSLPAVLEGSLPTASGYGRVRAVDPQVVAEGLGAVLAAYDGPTVVHCCHPARPRPAAALDRGGRPLPRPHRRVPRPVGVGRDDARGGHRALCGRARERRQLPSRRGAAAAARGPGAGRARGDLARGPRRHADLWTGRAHGLGGPGRSSDGAGAGAGPEREGGCLT